MSEPGLLPSQAATRQETLWQRAPGWRRLTIGASLLTLAAVAVPVLMPQPGEIPASIKQPAAIRPHVGAATATTPSTASSAPQPAPVVAMAKPAYPAQATPDKPPTNAAHPLAQPQAQANPAVACSLTMSTQALPQGTGTVIRFENPQVAQARLQANERINGASINPNYASTPRAIVRIDGAAPGSPAQVVVLPPGMMVHAGDHISYNSTHRDPGLACAYDPPLVATDDGPAQPTASNSAPLISPPPPGNGVTQPSANPSQTLASIAPDLPAGTVIVSPGVLAKVNQHNRGRGQQNFPVTIAVVSPPSHGTVTTRENTTPMTAADGVTRVAPVTEVFYQSAPGYTGQDTFTYKRTSTDPTDPLNARTFTVTVYVK